MLDDDSGAVVQVKEDPDVVNVMGIGSDVNWKDPDIVAECRLEGTTIRRDPDWK